MFRNDKIVPFFAALFATGSLLAAFLDGPRAMWGTREARQILSVIQVGLVAFAMVLLLYALMGYLSVWFEGEELRPGTRVPRGGGAAPFVVGLLSVVLTALAGMFARMIYDGVTGRTVGARREGLIAAAMFLCGAALVAVFKKWFLGEDVRAEPEESEVPW